MARYAVRARRIKYSVSIGTGRPVAPLFLPSIAFAHGNPLFVPGLGGLAFIHLIFAMFFVFRKGIIRKTENIYSTNLEILTNAQTLGLTSHQAALEIAQNRIESRRKEK